MYTTMDLKCNLGHVYLIVSRVLTAFNIPKIVKFALCFNIEKGDEANNSRDQKVFSIILTGKLKSY